ncbi:hypothetical protein KR018_000927 [Drosophila ironensis]|nr:hypothetical protein KR018_000927 [Drosophila ironensis]
MFQTGLRAWPLLKHFRLPVSTFILSKMSTKSGKPKSKPKKSMFSKVMKPMEPYKRNKLFKISIIGGGQVGVTISAFLLVRKLARHLVLVDIAYEKAQAEVRDFNHASMFLGDPLIDACGDGSKSKDSDLIIFTAGARPGKKSRLDVMHDSVKILKEIVPNLVDLSPNATWLVVSNPADVMAYAVQKIGKVPKHKCFTSGCHLDTARFRFFIAERLNVPVSGVKGYMIGEHGDSAVPVWSGVTVGGIPLRDVVDNPGCGHDPDKWGDINNLVTGGGRSVSKIKGYTNWAVGLCCVDIVDSMSRPRGRIMSVGTDVKGVLGIKENIVLSLPCLVNSNGISHIFQLALTNHEYEKLHKSAEILLKAQCELNL